MKFIKLLEQSIVEEALINEQVEEGIGKTIAKGALAGALSFSPVKKDIKNTKPDTELSTKAKSATSKYSTIVSDIIDNIEGGYYNPGQLKSKKYKRSGETMFGLDRLRSPEITKSPQGQEFWNTVDKNKKNWKWNDMGGEEESKLKDIAKDIMVSRFENYLNRYIKTDKAKNLIKNNYNLLFNFVYSTWNGQGWFKDFSEIVNSEIDKGNENPEDIFEKLIQARKNSKNGLIRQSAPKVEKLASKNP
jgi:hypothetical protein